MTGRHLPGCQYKLNSANHQHRESLICSVERGPPPGQRPLWSSFWAIWGTDWATLTRSHGRGVSMRPLFYWSSSSETLGVFEWQKISFDVEVCVATQIKVWREFRWSPDRIFFFRLGTLPRSQCATDGAAFKVFSERCNTVCNGWEVLWGTSKI